MAELPIIGERKFKLTDEEAQFLVDMLRRNFLYQRIEKVDSTSPPRVRLQMFGPDWVTMLHLCQKAGGWDLSPDQRAQLQKAHAEGKLTGATPTPASESAEAQEVIRGTQIHQLQSKPVTH